MQGVCWIGHNQYFSLQLLADGSCSPTKWVQSKKKKIIVKLIVLNTRASVQLVSLWLLEIYSVIMAQWLRLYAENILFLLLFWKINITTELFTCPMKIYIPLIFMFICSCKNFVSAVVDMFDCANAGSLFDSFNTCLEKVGIEIFAQADIQVFYNV